MPFFEYSQNNSGGVFDFDHQYGITTHVIVEAATAAEADERAESIGLYFDGAGDCSCCGSRWSSQDSWWGSGEGDEFPTLFGSPVWDYKSTWGPSWEGEGNPFVYVHFLDGTFAGVVEADPNYAVKGVRGVDGEWEFARIENSGLKALPPAEEDNGPSDTYRTTLSEL